MREGVGEHRGLVSDIAVFSWICKNYLIIREKPDETYTVVDQSTEVLESRWHIALARRHGFEPAIQRL
jgi:hypothetical protein